MAKVGAVEEAPETGTDRTSTSLDSLPREILVKIMSHLCLDDQAAFRLVCRHCYAAEAAAWELQRQLHPLAALPTLLNRPHIRLHSLADVTGAMRPLLPRLVAAAARSLRLVRPASHSHHPPFLANADEIRDFAAVLGPALAGIRVLTLATPTNHSLLLAWGAALPRIAHLALDPALHAVSDSPLLSSTFTSNPTQSDPTRPDFLVPEPQRRLLIAHKLSYLTPTQLADLHDLYVLIIHSALQAFPSLRSLTLSPSQLSDV